MNLKILITEFPWVGMHLGHVAFYARTPVPSASKDVRFPDGSTPPYGALRTCGTCQKPIDGGGVIVTLREK